MTEEIIEMPKDFQAFLHAIGKPIRFKVIMVLLKKPKMSLDEIRDFIRRQKEYCVWTDWATPHQIKQLELAGIVQNYLDSTGSWYEITPFGKQICFALIDSYNAYHSQRLL